MRLARRKQPELTGCFWFDSILRDFFPMNELYSNYARSVFATLETNLRSNGAPEAVARLIREENNLIACFRPNSQPAYV